MASAPPPRLSPLTLSMFQRYCERHLAFHLHAVRLSRSHRPNLTGVRERPLIVYLNHASWWDPLVCLHLAAQLLPERRHFAPIDAETLARHRIFGRLGFFGIDAGNPRGARRFLQIAARIFEQPGATLWIAPGGRLADPRERPLQLAPGLGHLACRLRQGVLVPLAIEYPFWTARAPEALLRFGESIAIEDAGMRARDWTAGLAAQLEATQEALAAEALAREPARFETLLGGGAPAAGGLQDLWRRFASRLRGRRFRPVPGAEP